MITRVVEYQCGVDVLGFPVYHQHIFFEYEKDDVQKRKITGNNILKNKRKLVNGIIQNSVKQH